VPIQQVNHKKVLEYIDYLFDKRLQPKTINNNLGIFHFRPKVVDTFYLSVI
jgi:hypothetical protein